MSLKKFGIFAIKLLVTAAIFWLLFSVVDIRAVVTHLSDVSVVVLVYAAFSYVLATYLATIRWSLLLSAQDISIPLSHLFTYNLSYSFYSVVLPGGKLAAEAVRIYQIVRDTGNQASREKIIIAALTDREVAVFSFVLVAAAFFLNSQEILAAGFPWWASYAAIPVVFLLGALAFVPLELLIRPFGRILPPGIHSLATSLSRAFSVYRSRLDLLGGALILSLIMNAVIASGFYAIALSLGLTVSFFLIFAVFSVGMVAAMMPLTVAGIGVREGAFAYLLAAVSGASLESGLSVSLLALGASLAVATIGGFVELNRHFLRDGTFVR